MSRLLPSTLAVFALLFVSGGAEAEPVSEPEPPVEPTPVEPTPVEPVGGEALVPEEPVADGIVPEESPLPVEVTPVAPTEPMPAEPAPVVSEPAPVKPVSAEPALVVAEPALDMEGPREVAVRLGGLKGGLNMGRFVGKVDSKGLDAGLALGGFLRIPIVGTLMLQTEVLMTDKGSKVKGNVMTRSEALLFVELPILARYDFYRTESLRMYGLGGPSIAYLIDANLVEEDSRTSLDFAVHLGVGAELPLTHHDVAFELRASQGLRNLIRDSSGDTARAAVMSLYAGITL